MALRRGADKWHRDGSQLVDMIKPNHLVACEDDDRRRRINGRAPNILIYKEILYKT